MDNDNNDNKKPKASVLKNKKDAPESKSARKTNYLVRAFARMARKPKHSPCQSTIVLMLSRK